MKTNMPILVFAAALLMPSARLPAQSAPASRNLNGPVSASPSASPDSPNYTYRLMALDMLIRQAQETSEREAVRERRARLSAATYDLNHDGKLDEKEFAAWEKAVRAAVAESPRLMKKYDKNHDKKLDDAEWAVAFRDLLGG